MATRDEAKEGLRQILDECKRILAQEPELRLSEADTRANFIDKYVALWGYEALTDVVREYYVRDSREFIDYVLKVEGIPRLALEAKPLDSEFTDRHAAQLVQYCAIEGIEWCLLSNARELRVYNQEQKGDLQSKLIHSLDLLAYNTDAEYDRVFSQFWLFSKESMSDPGQMASWMDYQRMDRWLRAILRNLSSRSVAEIRRELRREHNVRAQAASIVQWFSRNLRPEVIPFLVDPDEVRIGPRPKPRPVVSKTRLSLRDLMDAGLTQIGDLLQTTVKGRTYRGEVVAEGIRLPDGSVHKTPSGAGKAATGWKAVDGWRFWHYRDRVSGEWRPLDELRTDLRRHQEEASSREQLG